MIRFAGPSSWLRNFLLTAVFVGAVVAAGCGANPGDGDGGQCDAASCAMACNSDSQCSGATPRCDTAASKCAACLPANDNCASGQKCVLVDANWACAKTCQTAVDCPKSDAGAQQGCCNQVCTDLSGDRGNCGTCGNVCPAVAHGIPSCQTGTCSITSCEPGHSDCNMTLRDGCETATGSDPQNCGGCGRICATGPNSTVTCSMGICSSKCSLGYIHCSASPSDVCEVNSAIDPVNCGGCGKTCGALVNAKSTCSGGACVLSACNPGYADCNKNIADGCETNTQADLANCGGCLAVCALANAMSVCSLGQCRVSACTAGFGDCDAVALNGCEASLMNDVNNCGGCNRACTSPNGSAVCINGACTLASCQTGYADCDNNAPNGCEVRIATDPSNCGGCGKSCTSAANTTATCTNGTCGAGMCKFGFGDCNMNMADGCEANLLSTNTCGSCNVKCAMPANSSAGCNGGICGIGMCNSLFGDCDNSALNGCERPLANDVSNCGACNKLCSAPNASAACLNGQCGIAQCNAPYLDCDKIASNGCEVYGATDAQNCGQCGMVCPTPANSNPVCSNSVCSYRCGPGYGDCDKLAANGCEKNLGTDVMNCGACGTACGAVANGTPVCNSGSCAASCSAGYGNCDGSLANGCEKTLLVDVNNCGACGKVCSFANATAACLNGQCGFLACKTGFADCDNNTANGCEVNLNSNSANCGSCNKACPNATPSCVQAMCVKNQCTGIAGGVVAAAMGSPLYGACWYLGTAGSTCDAVCAAVSATNVANSVLNSYPDDCTGGAAGQPATWFFQNGNAGNWTVANGASTGYRTLGHGYNASTYYGKCLVGLTLTSNEGAFPGETNDRADRSAVCACSK